MNLCIYNTIYSIIFIFVGRMGRFESILARFGCLSPVPFSSCG